MFTSGHGFGESFSRGTVSWAEGGSYDRIQSRVQPNPIHDQEQWVEPAGSGPKAAARASAQPAPRPETTQAESTKTPSSAPRDTVEVEKEKDHDSERVAQGLSHSFGAEQEIPRRGSVSSSEDGRMRTQRPDGSTEVTRADGSVRTRSRGPNGQVEIREQREDGSLVEQSSYQRQGASIRERTVTQENGEARSVTEVRRGDRVERTVAVTRNVEGDIHDRSSRFSNGDAALRVPQVGAEGEELGPMQRTRTVRKVSQGEEDPEVFDDSVTYSQAFRAQSDEVGHSLPAHPMLAGPQGNLSEPGRSVHSNLTDSGEVRLAVSQTRVRNGQTVDEQTVAARSQFGTASNSYHLKMKDGKPVQEVGVVERRGLEQGDIADVFSKDEYRQRLGSGPIDYRETTTQPYDEQGRMQPSSQHIEAGDIDQPNRAGSRTISVDTTYGDSNANFQRAWSYHRADGDGQGGVKIQEQTSIQGSDAYTLTEGHIGAQGDSRMRTQAFDGDRLLLTQVRQTDRLPASRVRPEDFEGSSELAREFLQHNSGDLSRSRVTVTDPEGSHSITSLMAASGDRLQEVRQGDSSATLLQRPGSDIPFKGRASDGDELQVGRDGKILRVHPDGVVEEVGDLGELDVNGGLNQIEKGAKLLDKAGKVGGGSGAAGKVGSFLGGLTGALDLAGSENLSQSLSNSSGIADGLSSLSKVAASRLAEGGVQRALGVGSKLLGGASSALGVGSGLAQFGEGDRFGGAVTVVGGLGGIAGSYGSVVGAGSLVPGVGWTVAGLAMTTGLVRSVIQEQQAREATHPLEFD